MKKRYIIFNKPWGVLSQFTTDSPEIHQTLDQFSLPKEVYAAGRLDKDSEGLLLLTNDGTFIKNFLASHPRTYWVQVEGEVTKDHLLLLSKGIILKDGLTKPANAKLLGNMENYPKRNPPIRERKTVPTSWIELELKEGKNRQVRRMTAAIGIPTLRLIRVGLGSYKLDSLPVGQWVEVSKGIFLKDP